MDTLITYLPLIYLVTEWALRALAVVIVPRRRLPASGTAWLLVIFLLPVPGWILFLVLGNYKLPKARMDIQTKINNIIDDRLLAMKKANSKSDIIANPEISNKYASLAKLTFQYGRLPSLGANGLTILHKYDDSIESIARDIDRAKRFVYVEYFILTLDHATQEIFAAMERAARRGVNVKVLYDSLGSRKYAGRKQMLSLMNEAGIEFKPMLPLRLPGKEYVRPDLRNHRKIVVVDNEIGYTGSQNLIERTYNRKDDILYDELVVRVTGPIVTELSVLFITDWMSEGGEQLSLANTGGVSKERHKKTDSVMQLLPSGPGFEDENNLKVFTHLLHLADTQVTIVNPYFVPTESLLSALVSTARRGVRVMMVNSEAMDQWMVGYAQRSFYETLLEAGVELYLYKKPRLLHSKFMVVDHEVAIVGSSNLDIRSFELDCELSLICYDEKISHDLESVAYGYIRKSHQMKLKKWQQRSLGKQVLENIARLTSSVQ